MLNTRAKATYYKDNQKYPRKKVEIIKHVISTGVQSTKWRNPIKCEIFRLTAFAQDDRTAL